MPPHAGGWVDVGRLSEGGLYWYNAVDERLECGLLKMAYEIRCPRCGNTVRGGARFCAVCGLDLMGANVVASQPNVPTPPLQPPSDIPPPPQMPPPLPYIPQGTPTVWAPPEVARGAAVGVPTIVKGSIIAALTPSRPASGAFWTGLVLVILSLVLVACPSVVAFAIAVDPVQESGGSFLQSVFGLSCCLFLGLLLSGAGLLAVGRPRR